MKLLIVYGTRPEIIKLIPLILELHKNQQIDLVVVNTGQHKEMVDGLEASFKIEANYRLEIMQENQTLTGIMVRIAQTFEPILLKEKPDLVLIQGDTSTVATVGLVCFYNKIRIAHIEAGLRSFDLNEPFPEEFNRRLISMIADYNFAPTINSSENLAAEGIHKDKIYVTGNTIVDMVNLVDRRLKLLNHNEITILVTAHRRENHGAGIKNICKAIKRVISEFPDVKFIWPVHPNPNVKNMVFAELSNLRNVSLLPPQDYWQLSALIKSATLVWSDSGGIQEECPSYKKPILILRNVTERPEVVSSGFGTLVGTEVENIIFYTRQLLDNTMEYKRRIAGMNPFGNGDASKKIIEAILINEQVRNESTIYSK